MDKTAHRPNSAGKCTGSDSAHALTCEHWRGDSFLMPLPGTPLGDRPGPQARRQVCQRRDDASEDQYSTLQAAAESPRIPATDPKAKLKDAQGDSECTDTDVEDPSADLMSLPPARASRQTRPLHAHLFGSTSVPATCRQVGLRSPRPS